MNDVFVHSFKFESTDGPAVVVAPSEVPTVTQVDTPDHHGANSPTIVDKNPNDLQSHFYNIEAYIRYYKMVEILPPDRVHTCDRRFSSCHLGFRTKVSLSSCGLEIL
jgi:hypothetical protein